MDTDQIYYTALLRFGPPLRWEDHGYTAHVQATVRYLRECMHPDIRLGGIYSDFRNWWNLQIRGHISTKESEHADSDTAIGRGTDHQ